jgi:hypothetical protein
VDGVACYVGVKTRGTRLSPEQKLKDSH